MNAESTRLVEYLLLELNVLNVQDIERQLRNIGARSVHAQVKRWLLTVARNYILNMEAGSAATEFEPVTGRGPRKGQRSDIPSQLPDWVNRDLSQKRTVHFFQKAQPRRRQLWKDIELVVDWFNTLDKADPVLNRIDRISFDQAKEQANRWWASISENPWAHVKDKPPTVMSFKDGWKWVQLVKPLHFKREGEVMRHCVGSYYSNYAKGQRMYYSLRDPNNEPHITVETETGGGKQTKTLQIKGKNNGKPNPKYQPYLREFLKQNRITIHGDAQNVDKEDTIKGHLEPAQPA